MNFPSEYEPNLFYNHQNREPGDQQAHTHTHTHTHTQYYNKIQQQQKHRQDIQWSFVTYS